MVVLRLAVLVPLRLAVLAVRVAVVLLVRVAVLAVRVAVPLVLLAVLAVRVAVPLLVRVVFRFAAMEVVVFVIFMVCFCFFGEKCFSSGRNVFLRGEMFFFGEKCASSGRNDFLRGEDVFLRGEDVVDSFALQEFLNSKSGTFSKKCRSFLGFLGLFSG